MDDRLRAFLSGMEFPCDRAALLRHAAASGAGDDILGHLGTVPERDYPGIDEVVREVRCAPGQN